MVLSNGLDKINIRLHRRQFARRRARLPNVTAVGLRPVTGWQRSLGGPALDLSLSGGRALSRGIDLPRDRAAGKDKPASRHIRVTIPSAVSVARACHISGSIVRMSRPRSLQTRISARHAIMWSLVRAALQLCGAIVTRGASRYLAHSARL